MAIVSITNGDVTKGCVGLGLGFDWNCRRRTGDKRPRTTRRPMAGGWKSARERGKGNWIRETDKEKS